MSITAPTKPAWLSLTDNGDGTAALSGMPASSDVGVHNVDLLITDGGLTSMQSFTITVSAAPVDTYILTINITGSGSVSKQPDQAVYNAGEIVALSATPDTGWQFNGWSGHLSSSANPANITMDGNKVVTATFSVPDWVVDNLGDADDGDVSAGNLTLREAVNYAAPGESINFEASLAGGTIDLQTELQIRKNLSIDGGSHNITLNGDPDGDGQGNTRLFGVYDGAAVTISGLTLAKGNNANGGAMWVDSSSAVTLSHVAVVSSTATNGGAISNGGILVTLNSSFSGNSASDGGGAIANIRGGDITIANSTFNANQAMFGGGLINNFGGGQISIHNSALLNNSASWGGAAIMNQQATLIALNSTFSGNRDSAVIENMFDGQAHLTHVTLNENSQGIANYAAITLTNSLIANSVSGDDCYTQGGSLVSQGHNLIEDGSCGFAPTADLQLDPLALNGGDTLNHAITFGPAFNTADGAFCPATDQRGVARPVGPGCDVGAIEAEIYNQSPGFTSAPAVTTVMDGESYSYAITTSDPNAGDGDTVTLSALTKPAWLILNAQHDGSAVLSGVPNTGDVGSHNVSLQATDAGDLTATQSFSITVEPKPPVTLMVHLDGDGSGAVSSAPAGIDCGASCSASFAYGSAVVLTVQPTEGSVFGAWNACDSPSGNTCVMQMNDAKSVTAFFDQQQQDNYPPTALNDQANTEAGQSVLIRVLDNDVDADGLDVTSVVVTQPPTNGAVAINLGDGSISYTPNAEFSGEDSFNYTVADVQGAVSNVAIVNINVQAVSSDQEGFIPSELTLYVSKDGPLPETQQVILRNSPRFWVGWRGSSWLHIAYRHNWIYHTETQMYDYGIDLTVQVEELDVGVHYGNVTLWNRHNPGTEFHLPVTVIVSAEAGGLALNRSRLAFSGIQNQSTPLPQTVGIGHTGSATMTWTARSNAPWLTLVTSNGVTPSDLPVGIDPAKMAEAGEHSAKIFINDGVQDHEVSVKLTVIAPEQEKIALTGLEVTQVIQNLHNEMPLVAGKTTIVRAHVRSRLEAGIGNVTARLIAEGDSGRLGTIDASNVGGTVNVEVEPDRGVLDDSFYFEIPTEWTSGTVTFTFEGRNQTIACAEVASTPDDCQATVTFQEMPAMPITLIDVPIPGEGDVVYVSTQTQRDGVLQNLLATYPVAELDASYGGAVVYTPEIDPNPLYYAHLVWDRDGRPRVHYLALDAKGGGGMAGVGAWTSYSTVSGWGGYAPVHELGHNMGFGHVAGCSNPSSIDTSYPHPEGRISGALTGDAAAYGFDSRNTRIVLPTDRDFMTYCGNWWWSDYYYSILFERVEARWDSADRTVTREALVATAEQAIFMVSGMITSTHDIGSIKSVVSYTATTAIPAPEAGDYTLQLLDSSNQVITAQSFGPSNIVDAGFDGSTSLEEFSVPLPYSPDVAKVVLLHQGIELAHRSASAHRPTVILQSPNGGEVYNDGLLTVFWEGADDDDDTLTYYVEYSPDGGQSWQPVGAKKGETSLTLNVDALAGSQQALVLVGANDGFHTTWSQSAAVFTVSDKRPTASILSPSDAQVYITGQEIVLKGYGVDHEDGNLAGSALTWYSDRHIDPLGTGKILTLVVEDLATGKHIITLVARDSAGQSSVITAPTATSSDAAPSDPTDRITFKVYRDRPIFPAALAVAPAQIGLVTTLGSAEIVTTTLSLRNSGDGAPIAWRVTASGDLSNLLQFSRVADVTPETIIVSLNPSTLTEAGLYSGTLTFSPAATETREIEAVEIPYTVNVNEAASYANAIYLPLVMK